MVEYVSPWLVNQKLGIKEGLHLGIVAVFCKTRTKRIDGLSDGFVSSTSSGAEAATSKKKVDEAAAAPHVMLDALVQTAASDWPPSPPSNRESPLPIASSHTSSFGRTRHLYLFAGLAYTLVIA